MDLKYYISEQGKPFFQNGNFWKSYAEERNLKKGESYHGFRPLYNLDLSKKDLFSYLKLWENLRGVGVDGIRLEIAERFITLRSKSDMQLVITNIKDPVFAGDIIVYKGVDLYVVKAHGEQNPHSEAFIVDCLVQRTPLKIGKYEDFLAMDILITNQYLQNRNIEDTINDIIVNKLMPAIVADLALAFAGPVSGVPPAAVGGLIPTISADIQTLQANNTLLQDNIEDNKLHQ